MRAIQYKAIKNNNNEFHLDHDFVTQQKLFISAKASFDNIR